MTRNDFTLPPMISDKARRHFKENFSRSIRDAMQAPAPDDIDGWEKRCALECKEQETYIFELIERYGPTLIKTEVGGVPVLDIRPKNWVDNHKVIVHAHGGGFVSGTSRSALICSLPIATESGLRVVSVDYVRAPRAHYEEITEQVYSVILGLLNQGYSRKDIVVLGESAGSGLVAATALKVRDRGHGLLAATVVWSPWVDLTCVGDTHITIRDEEPFYQKDVFLAKAALAYAPQAEHTHPYASPIYADYSQGFPPTLIQAGSREILLSDSIRFYQALDLAGQSVKLDLYDGMWHVFQAFPIDSPEAMQARAKYSRCFRIFRILIVYILVTKVKKL